MTKTSNLLDKLRSRLKENVEPDVLLTTMRELAKEGMSRQDLQIHIERFRAVNDVTSKDELAESNAVIALDMIYVGSNEAIFAGELVPRCPSLHSYYGTVKIDFVYMVPAERRNSPFLDAVWHLKTLRDLSIGNQLSVDSEAWRKVDVFLGDLRLNAGGTIRDSITTALNLACDQCDWTAELVEDLRDAYDLAFVHTSDNHGGSK